MIQRILIAFDFSAPARRALELGVMLGRKLDAEVHVATILEEKAGATRGNQDGPHLQALERALELEIQDALHQPDHSVHYHALAGNPVEALTDLAKEIEAPMIIVGTTGKGAVARTLLGSVSNALVQRSGAIVMTVP